MKTLIFYVLLCTNQECNEFQPYTWTVTTEESIELALKECSTLANAYDTLQATKEVDCHFEEVAL